MLFLNKKIAYSFRFCFFAGVFMLLSAQKTPTREYQVKAVFLFNFTQFVEWPSSVFSSPQSPLVIGVLGTDPFGSYLDQTVAGEVINGHPLAVKRYKSVEEVKDCQLIYISLSEVGKMEQILLRLKGKNILTVSDAPAFMKQGGMIRFYTADNKIQLQINPEAAKAEGLTISSKLLRLATIFVPAKK